MELNKFFSTSSSGYIKEDHRTDWLVLTIISVVFLIIFIWILFSLVHYGIKTGKWRHIQSNNPEKLNVGLIYSSVIGCAVCCLLHEVVILLYTNTSVLKQSTNLCNILSDLLKSVYALVVFTVNLFLWLRQKAFYSNQMLNINFSKSVKMFSFASIFAIFFGGVAALILASLPRDEIFFENSCVYLQNENSRLVAFLLVSLVVIFGQISLLYLFAYALYNSKQNNASVKEDITKTCKSCLCCLKNNDNSRNTINFIDFNSQRNRKKLEKTTSHSINQFDKSAKEVRLIIKKCTLFAVLSMLADVFVLSATFLLLDPYKPKYFALYAGNFSVFFNLLFIILSFVHWKDLITSPFSFKNVVTNSSCRIN